MAYSRTLNLAELLKRKSFFLFGPRATGKTTLIHKQLKNARVYDLLDAATLRALMSKPSLLLEQNTQRDGKVFEGIIAIDEIQKAPLLLDEVQRLMGLHNMRFLLTGSSARKLKRGSANLLAGRAWWAELYPLTRREIAEFDLMTYLNTGGLPTVYANPEAEEELKNYVGTYVREEIMAEALTRNVVAFSGFLDVIALSNGEELNYESLSSDCGVSAATLKNYVSILADTLLGFSLAGFTKTKKRKAISRAKHYLFDLGVTRSLAHRGLIQPKSELFGRAFEHFIIAEVRAYLGYTRSDRRMTYWRSTSQFEVDLIIGSALAIEIKGTSLVQDKHLKGLRALKEEGLIERYTVVSLDPEKRTTSDGIVIYPWREFLDDLYEGKV